MSYFSDLHLRLTEAGIDPDVDRWCPECGQRLSIIGLQHRTAECCCTNGGCRHHREHLFLSGLPAPAVMRSSAVDGL